MRWKIAAGLGNLWHIDIADQPLDLVGLDAAPTQKMPVPDRSACGPAIHADALADQVRGATQTAALRHIKIACGKIPQRKRWQRNEAAIASANPSEVLPHGPFTRINRWVGQCSAQQRGAIRPGAR